MESPQKMHADTSLGLSGSCSSTTFPFRGVRPLSAPRGGAPLTGGQDTYRGTCSSAW
jgi:hypothetical protein